MKRALIVGINYPGTSHALNGCVNDAKAMKAMLEAHFGFHDITMLLDAEATTNNILNGLETLVAGTKSGDTIFFHYSGHGSQVPNNYNNDYEPDGLDEIICPVDLNWRDKIIRDDDLKRIFDKVPAGVNLTVVLDCCNSGSGMDQQNQYQPLGEAKQADYIDPVKNGRFLPPPVEIQMINESRSLPFKPRALTRNVNETGLLISGCQSHQTSADAFISGKYMGACTYMICDVLAKKNYDCSYQELVEEVNHRMVQAGFTQRPELNGSAGLFGFKFLAPMGGSEPVPSEPTEDDRPTVTKPKPICAKCGAVQPTHANATENTSGSEAANTKGKAILAVVFLAIVIAVVCF